MAEAFTPNVLANLEAQTAFLASLNQNFATLQALLADVLSRSGVSPNAMAAPLDMGSNRIINLPTPANPTDVVRLQDLSGMAALEWILIGSGSPLVAPVVGFDGQVYIDSTTFNLWQNNGTTWTLIGSLQGPSGPGTGDMLKAQNLSGLANYATAQTNLGLVIGTNVQAYAASLAALSGIPTTAFGIGLLDLANAAALQALLTLGGAALLNVGTTGGTVAAGNDSRFASLAVNTQNANYTFQASDAANPTLVLTNSGSSYTWTIPPGIFSPGNVINVRSGVSSAAITLARGAGVSLTLAGSSTNKNYTLAAAGFGTIVCEGTNTFFVSGVGIS